MFYNIFIIIITLSSPGWVEVVWVAGVVPRPRPAHAGDGEGGAGGGGGVLHLYYILYIILYILLLLYYYNIHLYNTGARHQLPVVLPDHELGADDGGADNALQLQRAVLPHVDVRTPEYSHLIIIL